MSALGRLRGRVGAPAAGGSGLAARLAVARVIALASVITAVMGAGAVYAAIGQPAEPAGRGVAQAHSVRGTAQAAPLRVLSVSPAAGARGVDGADPVQVTFSVPLARDSPLPTLAPAVPGTWQRTGTATVTFTPAMALAPLTRVRVIVPAGQRGVRSAAGRFLPRRVVAGFRTGHWQRRRFEQLLAQLGYLPLSWTPAQHGVAAAGPGDPALSGPAAQLSAAYDPPAGTFSWRPGYPASLRRLWKPAAPNLILHGAVMAFQSDHGLTMDGRIGPLTWQAMLRAAAAGQNDVHGYTYALASKASPETLTIWHDGQVVFRHVANTGIPAAPTADGTYPVYLRYRFQIMRGLNPDGSHYADPVAFVAYFNGGDAVHYFPRASYGSPQSLGCVELPRGPAQRAWRYLTYGSLVTVAG